MEVSGAPRHRPARRGSPRSARLTPHGPDFSGPGPRTADGTGALLAPPPKDFLAQASSHAGTMPGRRWPRQPNLELSAETSWGEQRLSAGLATPATHGFNGAWGAQWPRSITNAPEDSVLRAPLRVRGPGLFWDATRQAAQRFRLDLPNGSREVGHIAFPRYSSPVASSRPRAPSTCAGRPAASGRTSSGRALDKRSGQQEGPVLAGPVPGGVLVHVAPSRA